MNDSEFDKACWAAGVRPGWGGVACKYQLGCPSGKWQILNTVIGEDDDEQYYTRGTTDHEAACVMIEQLWRELEEYGTVYLEGPDLNHKSWMVNLSTEQDDFAISVDSPTRREALLAAYKAIKG